MTASPHHSLRPGTRLGRYELVRYLGAGGMGTIYEAVHVDLKKRVGFKALRSSIAENEEARTRFLREGEAASRIRHPNVVDVFDVGVEQGTPYLVMELLEGEDLGELLNREGLLPVPQIVNIMLPVVAAVATAHEMGVLHRDLKPENIFLAKLPHGLTTPKLLDFGISKFVDTHEALGLTDGANIMGTPMYMSPEQATKSKTIDSRSDQYSIGVILYECATVEQPFKGDSLYHVLQAIVAGNFEPPNVYRPTLPKDFEALILRAMSTEPESRFPDLPSVGRALLQFADERDRAIWSPAFEPARVVGAPFNPSVPPPDAVPSAPPLPLTRPRQTPDKTTLSEATSERVGELKSPAKTGLYRRAAWGAVVLAGIAGVYLVAPLDRVLVPGKEESVKTAVAPDSRLPVAAAPVEMPEQPAIYRIEVRTDPEDAEIELDGVKVGTGSLTLDLPRNGTAHLLRVSAPEHETREFTFNDQPPPEHIALDRVETEEKHDVRARPSARGIRDRPLPAPSPTAETPLVPVATVPEPPQPQPAPPATTPEVQPGSPPDAPSVEFSKNRAPIID